LALAQLLGSDVKFLTPRIHLFLFLRKIIDRRTAIVKSFAMSHSTESTDLTRAIDFGPVVNVSNHGQTPDVLVVCEHASPRMPDVVDLLGLSADVAQSHIAWDPGASEVAKRLAQHLGAILVQGGVSRLIYDCNRPPEAPSAIPETSEVFNIPGNQNLCQADRTARIEGIYAPFCAALASEITENRSTLRLMVTVHSFTAVFKGQRRKMDFGILHGTDKRFACAMMQSKPASSDYDIRLNQPYSAQDGVTHTLDLHGAQRGLLNVMIEIRNDLIQTAQHQDHVAGYLANWIKTTLAMVDTKRGTP